MEFLLYLSTQSMDIYKLMANRIQVVENSQICRTYEIFGFYEPKTNTMSICTDKIKEYPNLKFNINQTLVHESVHYAQACKARKENLGIFSTFRSFTNRDFSSLGIPRSAMVLSREKQNDLQRAGAINPTTQHIEREAFWLEDSPVQTKKMIMKHCID